MIALVTVAVVVLALGGDFAYSRMVSTRAVRWERAQVRGPDGVRLDCRPYAKGTGEVAVLMVHGFGSSPAVFQRWADEFAGRGFACHAMRLPGFGEPLPAARRVTADDWRRAVDEEILALRRTHQEVWLVGHSMGAAACAEAALRHPDQVAGLVLLAPLCGVSSRRSLGVPPERLFALHRLLLFTDALETCFPIDAHDPAVAALEARDRYVPMNIYTALLETMRAGRAAGPRLRQPVFVAAARADRVVDFQAARQFADSLTAPRTEFVAVAPAGHVVTLDTGWRELCRQAETFMRSGGDSL